LKVVAVANCDATSHFVELQSSNILPLTPKLIVGFSRNVVHYFFFASFQSIKLETAWLAVLLCHPGPQGNDLILLLCVFIECLLLVNQAC